MKAATDPKSPKFMLSTPFPERRPISSSQRKALSKLLPCIAPEARSWYKDLPCSGKDPVVRKCLGPPRATDAFLQQFDEFLPADLLAKLQEAQADLKRRQEMKVEDASATKANESREDWDIPWSDSDNESEHSSSDSDSDNTESDTSSDDNKSGGSDVEWQASTRSKAKIKKEKQRPQRKRAKVSSSSKTAKVSKKSSSTKTRTSSKQSTHAGKQRQKKKQKSAQRSRALKQKPRKATKKAKEPKKGA